jgi:hypothetical protein
VNDGISGESLTLTGRGSAECQAAGLKSVTRSSGGAGRACRQVCTLMCVLSATVRQSASQLARRFPALSEPRRGHVRGRLLDR